MANTGTNTRTVAGPPATGPIELPKSSRGGASRRRELIEVASLVGALVLLLVIFSIVSPTRFLTVSNVQVILLQAAVPLIVGVGATLVILMGSIDLSVEGVMAAAGVTYVLLIPNTRSNGDLGVGAIIIALVIGLAMGVLTGILHTRLKVPTFIVTLGMWYVGLGFATLLYGTDTLPTIKSDALLQWPDDTPVLGLPNAFLLAAVVLVIGYLITRYTKLGRFAYAIGDNEGIARSNGVHVPRYKLAVFAVAGLCTGLAGIISSIELGSGQVGNGSGTLFLTIPAVVIGGTSLGGGRGGVLRTALGVLLLVTLSNGLIVTGVSSSIRSGVSGAVLILAVVAAAWTNRDRLAVAK